MPELPEIETIKTYLEPRLIGKSIKDIQIIESKQFIGDISDVIGTSVKRVERIGKVLIVRLSNNKFLNFHLKMSGQLFLNPKNENFKYVRVIITFDQNTHLYFLDMRKFGWVKVTNENELIRLNDVLSPTYTLLYLKEKVRTSHQAIKKLIMDQSIIAGVGNIYANDALFEAKILPSRNSSTLTDNEIQRLYRSIKNIIKEGIMRKGSSASQVYRLPDTSKGSYQDYFRVYRKEGHPCPVCNTPIQKAVIGGRSSFFCPHCQQ